VLYARGGINLRGFLYLAAGTMLILIAAYYGSFYVMPSISVVNNSGAHIKSMTVNLPSSHLDFGTISQGQTNTLHYSLDQADGVYEYQIGFADELSIQGKCGYVTQNEINKRVSLIIGSKDIVCS
jgi:hypothetical protein